MTIQEFFRLYGKDDKLDDFIHAIREYSRRFPVGTEEHDRYLVMAKDLNELFDYIETSAQSQFPNRPKFQ